MTADVCGACLLTVKAERERVAGLIDQELRELGAMPLEVLLQTRGALERLRERMHRGDLPE